jgi:hypothetical protein
MRKKKSNEVKEPESNKNDLLAHATHDDARDDDNTRDDNDARDDDNTPSTPTTTTTTRTRKVKRARITPKEPPVKRKQKKTQENIEQEDKKYWLIKGVI